MKSIIAQLRDFLAEEEKADEEYSGAITAAKSKGDVASEMTLRSILLDERKHAKLIRELLNRVDK